MSDRLRRYDQFGWDYEALTPLRAAEMAWHERWARRTGGPVLVLACGTGRLVCCLTERGHTVVGLDLSQTMLALARENVRRLPRSVRRRVRLVRADMIDLDLEKRFGLIAIPDNSFREVGTRANMRRCLRSIRDHVTDHGILLITERRLNRKDYPRSGKWGREMPHAKSGTRVARRLELKLNRGGGRISGRFQYRLTRRGADPVLVDCPIDLPALTVSEYVQMFAAAGFDTRVHVAYREKEDDGISPFVCYVCSPHVGRRVA